MENPINPAIMGAIEQRIVEVVLRLTEAHRLLNHLKRQLGYQCVSLEELVPYQDDEGGTDKEEETACSLTPDECVE